MGLAIIILTLIVKIILYPTTTKAIRAQKAMKEIEPHLKKVREEHKDNKQLQAKKTMELYQKHGVNPMSGCLPILIQLPVILGLYRIFWLGLAKVDTAILYSFIQAPVALGMIFLGIDLTGKSLLLALIAGVGQYFQTAISLGKQEPTPEKKEGTTSTFQEDFSRSMQMQMRYVFPFLIAFIAYKFSAAVALYWATSNILSIVQEKLVRRKIA